MAYPKEGTADWWELVARGYRDLIARPPKYLVPGSGPDHYRIKAEEAEATARRLRESDVFAQPTKAFEESLQIREAEMISRETADEFSKIIHDRRGYGLKTVEVHQNLADIGESVKVTEDVWKSVFKLV